MSALSIYNVTLVINQNTINTVSIKNILPYASPMLSCHYRVAIMHIINPCHASDWLLDCDVI